MAPGASTAIGELMDATFVQSSSRERIPVPDNGPTADVRTSLRFDSYSQAGCLLEL
jgi:hypothetical protein